MSRILVIDDEASVRSTVRSMLESERFDVVDVADGHSALRAAQSAPFDLAIVDLVMPGMDGLKTIICLRQADPDIPIIAISGLRFSGAGRIALDFLALAAHFNGVKCLQKPFRLHELAQAVKASMQEGGKANPRKVLSRVRQESGAAPASRA